MTYNKVVNLVHFCFVDILLPQFLADSLINTLNLNVGHLQVRFGLINALVRYYCWHILVGEVIKCIGHDG